MSKAPKKRKKTVFMGLSFLTAVPSTENDLILTRNKRNNIVW